MFFLSTNIIIILIISPLYVFIPAIVIYLVCCHILYTYTSRPQKYLTSLEGITKSPIVSCFNEILSGVATIRCYDVKQMFFHNNCGKINENKKPTIAKKASEVWFTFRLTIISFIINFTSLTYVLFFSTKHKDATNAAA